MFKRPFVVLSVIIASQPFDAKFQELCSYDGQSAVAVEGLFRVEVFCALVLCFMFGRVMLTAASTRSVCSMKNVLVLTS